MAGEAEWPRQFFIQHAMNDIQFQPVGADNLDLFIEVTRQALWLPAWPGADWFVRELERLGGSPHPPAYLILDGTVPVGRVILLQFDDYFVIRDLGLRPGAGRPERVARALLQLARSRHARVIRVAVYDSVWGGFADLGFVVQKHRMTMHRAIGAERPVVDRSTRHATPGDVQEIGILLNAAYRGTVDDEGEDLELWTHHARDVLTGQYGKFLMAASYVYPASPPHQSATLVVESAPACAVLGQVVTHPLYANQGLARRLIVSGLAPLASMGYKHWFLEVTRSNVHAVGLYRSLGFVELGPQIVYGIFNP
jgi:GNAT superfamily N-acetyltransferase